MPALSSIKRPHPVRIEVPLAGDEAVTIEFDRNAMTQNWVKRLQDGRQAGDVMAVARSFTELLLAWDVVEDNGEPTPITAEVLADLPLEFLKRMDDLITAQALPSSAEGEVSNATRSMAGTDSTEKPLPLGQSPNGPSLSGSQMPSEFLSQK